MRSHISFALVSIVLAAGPLAAQTPVPATATLRLTIDDAVKMALDKNTYLKADRLDPQISDTRVAAAAGLFKPSLNTGVNQNNQLQPPSSFLIPTPTRTDAVTSSVGVGQRLPWFGTTYTAAWNAVHTDSNSFLNSYNPLLTSGLSLTLSQPLVRDLSIDAARQQLQTSRINRDIADTRLRESVVHTTASVKSAYWNLVSAISNVDSRTSALNLAQELVRVNKAKVDVGQSPPLDLVSAQAEVASDEEQLIVAQTAVKQAEDRLRVLIFDPTDRTSWNVAIEPSDAPPVATLTPDLDTAVTRALGERADLARATRRPASQVSSSEPARSPASAACSTSSSPTTTRHGPPASASRIRWAVAPRRPTPCAPGSSVSRPTSGSRAAKDARFSRCGTPGGRST